MATLSTSLLILTALINDSFVIYHRPKVSEAFVCFDKENDTWPEKWMRLNAVIEDDIPTLRTIHDVPKNKSLIDYKLRFIYPDRSFGDSQWKQMLNGWIDYPCSTTISKDSTNDYGVIISCTVSVVIAFILCIIYVMKKMFT